MRPTALLTIIVLVACSAGPERAPDFQADRLLADISVLAHDSLLGRAPGTPGEEKTVAFLSARFAEAGLQPGNPDGSWTQVVDLVGITGTPAATFRVAGRPLPLTWRDDYVAVSRRIAPEIRNLWRDG